DRRRAARDAAEARLRRRRALRDRPRAARLRRVALERVGLGQTEGRRYLVVGALADDLARARRRHRSLRLPAVGRASRSVREGSARAAGSAAEQAADGRADDVLLPVPRPGGTLLRRPALPLGRARPLRARYRRPADAAVADAAGGRDRHPEVAAEREPA